MNPIDQHVEAVIAHLGPRAAFDRLIDENDNLIRSPDLTNGQEITAARTAIYTGLVRHWAVAQHRQWGYDKPFAVVALGGTGRGEMTPCSDNDFALLFDDTLEGNRFLLELQRQLLHTAAFHERSGFACLAFPFSLDSVPDLDGKQLNAFLDMQPVYDPDDLAARFRARILDTYDSFEHFLHVRSFWKDQWERAAAQSECIDRFDIKNEGLRLFLAGVWTLAGQQFEHSHAIYQRLEDPRDLEAYQLLLRIRAFVHLRRGKTQLPSANGNHPEDIMRLDDFASFGELLGPMADDESRFAYADSARARLLSARRRVARFARTIIERELRTGREVSTDRNIVLSVGGLAHRGFNPEDSPREKSRAALALLAAAQRYSLPVQLSELETTFHNAGDWLVRVPELADLFDESRGSLAASFAFLAQIDGAEERLFPGYAEFESSLDERVMLEGRVMRGALTRQKLEALDKLVREGEALLAQAVSSERLTDPAQQVTPEVEAALLDADHLAAVKLALKTKRLPLTPEDKDVRLDPHRPLHDRYSSGFSDIPLDRYYDCFHKECGFSRELLDVVEFLIAHRRIFKEHSRGGLNDAEHVESFVQLCGSENRLRALYVFTCADRAEWEAEASDPTRWFNSRELYAKAMNHFRPLRDPTRALEAAGYSADELTILKDFGEDFFTGIYRHYANRFGSHLLRLVEDPEGTGPKAALLRDRASMIIGIAARDQPGLAASITGALWRMGLDLRQAHLFSAMNHGLALDFFHIAPAEKPFTPDVLREVEKAVRERRYLTAADATALPAAAGTLTLREWRPGKYRLRFEAPENIRGIIYALTVRVFLQLGGNIFGLIAHAVPGRGTVSVYHSLPDNLKLEEARTLIEAKP